MFTRSVAISLLRQAKTGADLIQILDAIAEENDNESV